MTRGPANTARSSRRGDAARPGSNRRGWKLRRGWLTAAFVAIGLALAAGLYVVLTAPEAPSVLRIRAEAAMRDGRLHEALRDWHAVNRTSAADARSHLGEARACLKLGRAGQAERSLRSASAMAPAEPEPWLLQLEIARIENRLVDALRIGARAYRAAPARNRRDILRGWTLALLADAPDDLARATLKHWIASDPNDLDARAALERRQIENPRSGDPPLIQRTTELEALVSSHPEIPTLREALVLALAEAGKPDQGRALLESWPIPLRDARFHRLRGRWYLDYDHDASAAVAELRRALADLPHDRMTRYRLARALQAVNRADEARREAAEVNRLRELLEPVRLAARLDAAFAKLDDPNARLDLANLCESVALNDLAEAWRLDARQGAGSSPVEARQPGT